MIRLWVSGARHLQMQASLEGSDLALVGADLGPSPVLQGVQVCDSWAWEGWECGLSAAAFRGFLLP